DHPARPPDRAQGDLRRARQDRRAGHPRHRRGRLFRRSDRAVAGRAHRSAGHARRAARASRRSLRRALHHGPAQPARPDGGGARMSVWRRAWLAMLLLAALAAAARAEDAPVRISTKEFTESVILGNMLDLLARDAGVATEFRPGLGGTRVLWDALRTDQIDIYPEYTGTLIQEILSSDRLSGEAELRAALADHGLVMSRPLGFNNTYGIGMKKEVAERLGIRTISDLARHPDLRFGFSNEFMSRADGWPSLRDRYRLPQTSVNGLDHDLAYRGLASGSIDAI